MAPERPQGGAAVTDLTIRQAFLPHEDAEMSLSFYRDVLGFEVRSDVGSGPMRRITLGATGQPSMAIGLEPPATGLGITDEERAVVVELMRKGCLARIVLATIDLDGTFERIEASDAEVIQEPIQRPSGIRDCAFLDPAGTIVRIQAFPPRQPR